MVQKTWGRVHNSMKKEMEFAHYFALSSHESHEWETHFQIQ